MTLANQAKLFTVAVLALALPLLSQTPKAQIDVIIPPVLPSGSPDTRLSLIGTSLDQSSGVYVLDQGDNWIEFPFEKGASSTRATAVIPSSYFSAPRFVRLSPEPAFQYAQSVLVYSQAIAHAVVDPNWKVRVVPEDIGTGGQIEIDGSRFEPGMKAVLGRGNVAGMVLDTEILSESYLEAEVPVYVPGDDLFIAVLSADGLKISTPFGVMSTYPQREDDVSQQTTGPPPDDLNDEGSRLMKSRDYEAAAMKFVEAARVPLCRAGVSSAPKNCAMFANNAGFAYYKLAKYEESVAWVNKALAIDRKRSVAWLNLGDAYAKVNRNVEARQAYVNYLKFAPDSKSVGEIKKKLAALPPAP
jgi:Tetratricopeptide repeat